VFYRTIGSGALAVIALTALTAESCATGNTVNQPSTPAPSNSSAPAAVAAAAHVGATLTLNGASGEKLQVTLVRMVDPAPAANQFSAPPAGMREVATELRFKNIGTIAYSESLLTDVTVLDAASHSYSVDISGATSAGPGFPSDLVNLAAGESADGLIELQVPTATPVTEVKLSVSLFGGDRGEWLVP
jgi:hypothetical protein